MRTPSGLIQRAPEVAVLVVLEAALDSTASAFMAAHEDIGAIECTYSPAEPFVEAVLADGVLGHLGALREAVERYRTALERRPDWDAMMTKRSLILNERRSPSRSPSVPCQGRSAIRVCAARIDGGRSL